MTLMSHPVIITEDIRIATLFSAAYPRIVIIYAPLLDDCFYIWQRSSQLFFQRLTKKSHKYPELSPDFHAEYVRFVQGLKSLDDLVSVCYKSSSIGVHAWEHILRTTTQKSIDQQGLEFMKSQLKDQIYDSLKVHHRAEYLSLQFPGSVAIIGHDCYHHSTFYDSLLTNHIDCVLFYKYVNNLPSLERNSSQFSSSGLSIKSFSNYNSRYQTTHNNLRRNLLPDAMQTSSPLYANAMNYISLISRDRSHLPYMQRDSEGFITSLQDITQSIFNYSSCQRYLFRGTETPYFKSDSVVLILALHSFADQACLWGLDDGYLSCYDYFFKSCLQFLESASDNDYIAIRLHPNTFNHLHNSSDFRRDAASFDAKSQLYLYEQLYLRFGSRVLISNPALDLLDISSPENICFVSRFGTIGLQCLTSNIPIFVSSLAPYSSSIYSTNLVTQDSPINAERVRDLVSNRSRRSYKDTIAVDIILLLLDPNDLQSPKPLNSFISEPYGYFISYYESIVVKFLFKYIFVPGRLTTLAKSVISYSYSNSPHVRSSYDKLAHFL